MGIFQVSGLLLLTIFFPSFVICLEFHILNRSPFFWIPGCDGEEGAGRLLGLPLQGVPRRRPQDVLGAAARRLPPRISWAWGKIETHI